MDKAERTLMERFIETQERLVDLLDESRSKRDAGEDDARSRDLAEILYADAVRNRDANRGSVDPVPPHVAAALAGEAIERAEIFARTWERLSHGDAKA